MTDPLSIQLQREETKRRRCSDPRAAWRTQQETIEWASAQQQPPRNSIAGCLAHQRRHAQASRTPNSSAPRPAAGR
jgi:hypothetical protein